jgi:hypothetical protein
LAAVFSLPCVPSHASTFVIYQTPSGSTAGGNPVDAKATITLGGFTSPSQEILDVTIQNLQTLEGTVAQNISDLSISFASGYTSPGYNPAYTPANPTVNVAGNGVGTSGGNSSDTWNLPQTGSTIHLSALGGGQPKFTILGPPDTGTTYSNADSSIAGNGPHNPFFDQIVTFELLVNGVNQNAPVTAASIISAVVFSFGTTAGITANGQLLSSGGQLPTPTPLPGTMPLFATILGLSGLLLYFRKRGMRADLRNAIQFA